MKETRNTVTAIVNIAAIVLGLMMILAVCVFAKPCSGQLELATGAMVPMKCLHAGKAAVLLGAVLMGVGGHGLLKKQIAVLPLILIGIALIVLPMSNAIGIGVCVKEGMACHATALWMRIIGGLTLLDGVVGFFKKTDHDL